MFVLCPHCQFLVAVDPASGLPPAHCPRCNGAVLVEPEAAVEPEVAVVPEPAPAEVMPAEIMPADVEPVDVEPPEAPPPVDGHPAGAGEAAPAEALATPPSADAVDDAPAIAPAPVSASKPRKAAPSFVRTRASSIAPAPSRRRWPGAAAIAALSLVLALQILVADRVQLAADAQWRPSISMLCAALRCELPPWREPSAFTLLDRNVVPEPDTPGVLHVTARFRNDARWAQPWPQLLLTLSDVDGRIAGARVFEARDYLARSTGARAATQNGLASGQSAEVAMDIVEPAPRIVAFTFDFR